MDFRDKDRKRRERSRSREDSGRHHDRERERKRRHRSRSRSRESRQGGSSSSSSSKSDRREAKNSSTSSSSRRTSSLKEGKGNESGTTVSINNSIQPDRETQRALEQAALEEEMQKRRDRVKAWQAEKAKRLADELAKLGGKEDGSRSLESLLPPTSSGTDADASASHLSLSLPIIPATSSSSSGSAVGDSKGGNEGSSQPMWSLEDEEEDKGATNASLPAEDVSLGPLPSLLPPLASSAVVPDTISDVPREAKEASKDNEEEDEDFDPLEAYMDSLYSSGDVISQQRVIPQIVVPPGAPLLHDSARSITPSEGPDYSSDNEYFDGVNQYASSNIITMDQIMNASSKTGKGTKAVKMNSWESDTNPASPEEQDEVEDNEEREERERAEFLEAIRKAREKEEAELKKLDRQEAYEERSNDQLGIIYAEDGDVVEDYEIQQKKKSALDLLDEAKKGKELKPVDHSTITYLPFRKNLFIIPRALSRLNEEQVKEKRDELQIKVRGKGCPPPIETWEQSGLSDRILSLLSKAKLDAPFAVQKQALPAIMCGRDVIGVAKTGSGKTLCFVLPMLRHIQDQPPLKEGEGPIGLIMAPARELAFQIFNEAKKFTKSLGMRVVCVYGGAGVAEQIGELKRGAEIVVCTPGRMIDILCMQAGKLMSLRRVTMVVMDEADRMFDMGFEPQIKMILNTVRPDRQTVLFSATFPKQIERLARSILKLPLEIVVGERSMVNKDITQYVEVREEDDKFMRLLQLLGIWYERGSVLIFVDKQEKCDSLYTDLTRAGYPCVSLHGGKDQLDRDYTLHEFKTLIKTVMIATSVAGRGLDVPEIVVVINYNCPNHLEDYVHRVGRTGRAGRKGTAYTFIAPHEDKYAHIMVKALTYAHVPEIPAELTALAEGFKAKVARGEAQWSSSGFVGNKGYTFEADEMNEGQKAVSLQRRAYEIEQGIRDENGEENGGRDNDFDDLEEDEKFEMVNAVSGKVNTDAPTSSSVPFMPAPIPEGLSPIEKAKLLAAQMMAQGRSAPPTIESTLPPLPVSGPIDTQAALARAKLLAATLVSKPLNSSAESANPSGTASEGHFAGELEINDYPIEARKKATHRNTLDDIAERTGVNVISRGQYIDPTKPAKFGERKLYLLLEGTSELQVRQAKMEIKHILEEETLKLGSAISSGRYSVV